MRYTVYFYINTSGCTIKCPCIYPFCFQVQYITKAAIKHKKSVLPFISIKTQKTSKTKFILQQYRGLYSPS